MTKILLLIAISVTLLSPPSQVLADDDWTMEQLEVLESIERLSATTAPGGDGADGYAKTLADNFSRWTTGSNLINGKNEWVDGIRGWFNEGWRVADRNQTIIEITIMGDRAFVRRVVEETYLSPSEERTISKAALAESWIRVGGAWLLYWVNADVLEGP